MAPSYLSIVESTSYDLLPSFEHTLEHSIAYCITSIVFNHLYTDFVIHRAMYSRYLITHHCWDSHALRLWINLFAEWSTKAFVIRTIGSFSKFDLPARSGGITVNLPLQVNMKHHSPNVLSNVDQSFGLHPQWLYRRHRVGKLRMLVFCTYRYENGFHQIACWSAPGSTVFKECPISLSNDLLVIGDNWRCIVAPTRSNWILLRVLNDCPLLIFLWYQTIFGDQNRGLNFSSILEFLKGSRV